MKIQFLTFICAFISLSVFAQNQEIIVKNIPAPKALDDEFYDLSTSIERQRELASLGYIDFMECYCRQSLFFYYGLNGSGIPVQNGKVRDVLPFLEAGAKDYADFQFMYACILSGSEPVRNNGASGEEFIETPSDYQYMDLAKAKIYFQKYLNNPNRAERKPFGYENDTIILQMIFNVFPELIVGKPTVSMADVEEKPVFQGGGIAEFTKWVFSKMVYPESAKKNGVQGRVTLQFIIDTEGSVKNVEILRGVDTSLDNEAIRVVSSSPRWEPGKMKGSSVNTKVTFPVVFQLR